MCEKKPVPDDDFSRDAIFNGAVTIVQSRKGYRFSIDALLLAWYVSRLPGERALEFGTGSGVISLALCHQRDDLQILAVEQQESLFAHARQNVAENKQNRVELIRDDFRKISAEPVYDVVFSNPPFREHGRGRLNPHPEKAAARHELNGTLAELIFAARSKINKHGRISLILLYERWHDLQQIADKQKLNILQFTEIRPYAERPPNLFLVTLDTSGKRLPDSVLTIWESVNIYTPDVNRILAGDWHGKHPLEGALTADR